MSGYQVIGNYHQRMIARPMLHDVIVHHYLGFPACAMEPQLAIISLTRNCCSAGSGEGHRDDSA